MGKNESEGPSGPLSNASNEAPQPLTPLQKDLNKIYKKPTDLPGVPAVPQRSPVARQLRELLNPRNQE